MSFNQQSQFLVLDTTRMDQATIRSLSRYVVSGFNSQQKQNASFAPHQPSFQLPKRQGQDAQSSDTAVNKHCQYGNGCTDDDCPFFHHKCPHKSWCLDEECHLKHVPYVDHLERIHNRNYRCKGTGDNCRYHQKCPEGFSCRDEECLKHLSFYHRLQQIREVKEKKKNLTRKRVKAPTDGNLSA